MNNDRRNFLRNITATALTPGALALPQVKPKRKQSADSKSKSPRNVILIICDDLGFGDLGCYGSKLSTPHVDTLARGGARFTHFNAAHPICSASRAALLTGRYAGRSHTPGALFPDRNGMDLDAVTLADLFHRSGVRTQAVGKWHLGDRPAYLPTRRGFDAWYGVPYSDDLQPLPLMRDDQRLDQDTDRDLLTPRYTAESVKFIAEHGAQPFFLYLAYSYPHDPARASQRFRGKSAFGDYGDSVQEIDWSVGEIVKALDSKGILDNTLIMFTSDHGPWYQGSAGLLRGRKGTNFEGGHRVPFIAHWPRGLDAGEVKDAWGSNLDVLPTLASLCSLPVGDKQLDGVDMSSVWIGGGAAHTAPERATVLYFAPIASGGWEVHCARKGNYKLRVAQIAGEMYISDQSSGRQGFWLPRPELYDLGTDPLESYDVAHEHPDVVRAILTDIQRQLASFPPEAAAAFAKMKLNVARKTTPPGASPRPDNHSPLPAWAWEPLDRRET